MSGWPPVARTFGREAELKRLDRVLDDALQNAHGECVLAVVEGVAGSGRSTLLSAVADRAAGRGFSVTRWPGEALKAGGDDPRVVIADDIDAVADSELAEIAPFLRRPIGSRTAFIAATGIAPAPRLARLLGRGRVERLRLACLPRAAVEAFALQALAGSIDDATVDALVEASGGHPALLAECVAELTTALAAHASVADAARALAPAGALRHLVALTAQERAVVNACAVWVGPVPTRHAAALAELPVELVDSAADRLALAGILAPERPLRFVGAALGRAAAAALPADQRMVLHGRAADGLLAERSDQAAPHVLATGGAHVERSAAARALRAAARTTGVGIALRYVRLAEELAPAEDCSELLLLARTILLAGEPGARGPLAAALAVCEDRAAHRSAQTLLAWEQLMSGESGGWRDDECDGDETRIHAAAAVLDGGGPAHEAVSRLDGLLLQHLPASSPVLMRAVELLCALDRAEDAVELLDELVGAAERVEAPAPLAAALAVRAAIQHHAGAVASAATDRRRANAVAETLAGAPVVRALARDAGAGELPIRLPWHPRFAAASLSRARSWGTAGVLGRALAAAPDPRRRRAGAELLACTPWRLDHASARLRLGEALRRGGELEAARRAYHEALDIATACCADSLSEAAHRGLRAAGGRIRQPRRSGVGALTSSEREVVELALAGRTNREIAETLVVTVKAVEHRLSGVYRKLEIRTRAEIAGALSGE